VTGTPEHFVHALTRDAKRTGELGLAGARLVRREQGTAKITPGSVKPLKRVECLTVRAQHSLDFGVVCDGRTILGRGGGPERRNRSARGTSTRYAVATCTCDGRPAQKGVV
jgi:hypothetical protein